MSTNEEFEKLMSHINEGQEVLGYTQRSIGKPQPHLGMKIHTDWCLVSFGLSNPSIYCHKDVIVNLPVSGQLAHDSVVAVRRVEKQENGRYRALEVEIKQINVVCPISGFYYLKPIEKFDPNVDKSFHAYKGYDK